MCPSAAADIGRPARNPEAAKRSVRRMSSAATTNSQSRRRKPALVSCSTSSGTRYVVSARWLGSTLRTEDERRMPDPDHVAIGELPGLYRGAVDRRAVGGAEVGKRRCPAVPGDLEVPPGHASVRQPELCLLAPAHDRGALG